MLRKSVVMLAILLCSLASQVYALGLGTVTVESYLNQPLRVRIEILQLGDTRLEDITVQIGTLEDFERFNIERISFLSNLRFRVEATASGNFVYITTNQVVREPYLSFILDTRWPNGRLLSEHTVLLDLPVFQDQQSANPDTADVRRPISPVLRAPDNSASASPDPEPSTTPSVPVAPATSVAPILEPEIIAPEPADPEPEPAVEPEDQSPMPESAAVAEPEPVAEEPEQVAAVEPDEIEPAAEPVQEQEVVEPEPVIEEVAAEEAVVTEDEPATTEEAVVAEQPIPEPEVEAEPEPVEPETLVTSTADTLTEIAEQVRPDGLSLQQTMLALQELNPDAFIDGNINRLRSGQVLRVPTREEVAAIDPAEATAEISRQNQQVADVQPLAAPASTTPDQDQAPQGQLSVVTADDAIDATSGAGDLDDEQNDELDRRIAELENQLALRLEEADRARIEREELDSRLAELENQIDAAEEIIRLQDLQLAQLQESIAQAAAEAQVEAQAQAAAAAAQAEIAATQPQPANSMMDDIMRILTGNTLMMIFGVVLVILLLVVLLIRRNRAAADREEDELDELAEQEFDAAAEEEQSLEASAESESESVADFDTEQEFDQELDDILGSEDTASADSELDAAIEGKSGTEVDSVEIDQLIAEGNLSAAEALLREQLENSPDEHEQRIKLCQVLAQAGNESEFNAQADIIAEEQSPRLDREVLNLREEFNIDAPDSDTEQEDTVLDMDLGDDDGEEKAEESVAANPEIDDDTSSFLDDLGIDLDSFDDEHTDFDLTDDEDPKAEPEESKESEAEKESALIDDLEFDSDDVDMTFDLGDGDGDGDEEEGSEKDEEPDAAEEKEDEIDLTADLEDEQELVVDDEPEGEEEPVDDEEPVAEVGLDLDAESENTELTSGGSKDADEIEIDSLDFDADDINIDEKADEPEEEIDLETFAFDTEDVKPEAPAEEEAESVAVDEENLLDFDIDETEVEVAPVAEESVDEDLETFEFDIDEEKTVAEPAPEAAGDSDADDFDFDLDEFDVGDDEAEESSASNSAVEIELDDDGAEDDILDLGGDEDVSIADDDIEIDLEADDEPEDSADVSVDAEEDDLDDLGFLSDDDEVEIESVGDIEEVEVLADEDETATKLELAYAYQKMGDVDGAKEILQEVVKEGNDEQVREAEKLIASLDEAD